MQVSGQKPPVGDPPALVRVDGGDAQPAQRAARGNRFPALRHQLSRGPTVRYRHIFVPRPAVLHKEPLDQILEHQLEPFGRPPPRHPQAHLRSPKGTGCPADPRDVEAAVAVAGGEPFPWHTFRAGAALGQ